MHFLGGKNVGWREWKWWLIQDTWGSCTIQPSFRWSNRTLESDHLPFLAPDFRANHSWISRENQSSNPHGNLGVFRRNCQLSFWWTSFFLAMNFTYPRSYGVYLWLSMCVFQNVEPGLRNLLGSIVVASHQLQFVFFGARVLVQEFRGSIGTDYV